MKRVLAVAGLVAGVALTTVPAQAAVGGKCDGKIDVMCQRQPCQPDYPCHIEFCAVWYDGECGIR